jgi:hypothetical protein
LLEFELKEDVVSNSKDSRELILRFSKMTSLVRSSSDMHNNKVHRRWKNIYPKSFPNENFDLFFGRRWWRRWKVV